VLHGVRDVTQLITKEKDIRRLIEAIKILHEIAAPPVIAEKKRDSITDLLTVLREESERMTNKKDIPAIKQRQ
jgi:hypothetical protein